MALTKRIIPCLDVRNGETVKGIQFERLRELGDPVAFAAQYAAEGADELVFLDITATNENRKTFAGLISRIAGKINIPFTVGGGIRSADDVYALLSAGADKVSVNTAAVKNPGLLAQLAGQFGSQCVVLAVDTKYHPEDDEDYVYLNGGRIPTPLRTADWIRQAADLGAGEILLTSIDHDGMRGGFALGLTRRISASAPIPVIASGGAGSMEHFGEVFTTGHADAALAAGIFHNREISIPRLKQYLNTQKINVRI